MKCAPEELIESIVTDFYSKAVTDTLIGYQFRKIQQQEGLHPLMPPMEAFRNHIPRIVRFWQLQLIGRSDIPPCSRFDLLGAHRKLNLNRGELDRWMALFRQTLEERHTGDSADLIEAWSIKLEEFKQIFIKDRAIFS